MANNKLGSTGAVDMLKQQIDLLQQELDKGLKLKAMVTKSLEQAKPTPGLHPSKTATPGTWCFGCDNPKLACKCRKGDDEEEEENEEQQQQSEQDPGAQREKVFTTLHKMRPTLKDLTQELELLFTQYFELRTEIAALQQHFYDFRPEELQLYDDLRAYLAATQREILGLDGKPLSADELQGLMKYCFLLVPDALELKNIEELYAVLQSHDFQRLAYDYASLRLALHNTPAGDLLDKGVQLIFDPEIVARPLGFHEYSANAALQMQTQLRLVYRDGKELTAADAEQLWSLAPFRDFANTVSKFNQVLRPSIHEQIVPQIQHEDQQRRLLVTQGRSVEAAALPSAAQAHLMQDHLSQHLAIVHGAASAKSWQPPKFTPSGYES